MTSFTLIPEYYLTRRLKSILSNHTSLSRCLFLLRTFLLYCITYIISIPKLTIVSAFHRPMSYGTPSRACIRFIVSRAIYRPNRIMPYANSINLYCPTSNISIYTVLCILYRFVQHYVHSIDLSICFAPIISIYTRLCNNSPSSSHCYNVLSRTFTAGYF